MDGSARATRSLRRTTSCSHTGGNLAHAYAASETPEDEAAAWEVDGAGNRWFLDPIFRGSYPADLLERNELVAPVVQEGRASPSRPRSPRVRRPGAG